MESKTWFKFSHIIVFLLLATSFETLMAQNERVIKLSDGSQGKQRWPELIGVPAKLAKETIQKDNPTITLVEIILNGSPVTLDSRFNRVRLFVNVLDYVVQIPVVG